jgi:hypothetical protein
MPGLDPGIDVPIESAIKIKPIWIVLFDQFDFPAARPRLDGLLPLDRALGRHMLLHIDKPFDAVSRRKARG